MTQNSDSLNLVGYRVISGEADDVSDLLSSEFSTGAVTAIASSEWSQNNKDHTFNVIMDATTARVGGWVQISVASS